MSTRLTALTRTGVKLSLDLPAKGNVYTGTMSSLPITVATDLVRIDLAVEGMTCSACSNQIQRQLTKLDGIADARVNFANGRATVLHDGTVDSEQLKTTIEGLGYTVPTVPDSEGAGRRRLADLQRRLVVAYDLIVWKLCDWIGLIDESSSSFYFEEDGINGLVYAIFSGVIFAPIAEEIFFRGFLFQSLERRSSFWPATLISTFLFAMIHFYDFQGSLSVASFGIVACVLYRATGSLWTPIIYHAITNGIITASSWPLYNGLYSKW